MYKEISSIGIINIQNQETILRNKLVPLGVSIKNLEKTLNEDSLHYKEFMDSQHGSDKHCVDPSCPYEEEVKKYEKAATIALFFVKAARGNKILEMFELV